VACRCGAFRLLTATGLRYEENAGAICRHTQAGCRWFAPSDITPVERSALLLLGSAAASLRCACGLMEVPNAVRALMGSDGLLHAHHRCQPAGRLP